MNIVLATVPQNLFLAVRRKIVQYQVYPLVRRILFPGQFQNFQELLMPLAWPNISPELFLMDIVKRQPVLNAMFAGIGRRQPLGMVGMTVIPAWLRTNLQRSELVE
nr:hypothetical protein [Anaerohalosphaera lusitana]